MNKVLALIGNRLRRGHAVVVLFFFPIFQSACVGLEVTEPQQRAADVVMEEITQCRFDRARMLTDSMIAADSAEPLYWMLSLCAEALRQLDNAEISDPDAFTTLYERSKKNMPAWDHCTTKRKSYLMTMKGFMQLVAAAHTMQRKSYWSGLRLGLGAVSLCNEAKQLDTLNRDAELVGGLYNYARAELKRKFFGILFWYPGNKEAGMETIRRCSHDARIVAITSEMILQEIYTRENMMDSAAIGISRLLERYPGCRFILWTKAKMLDAQKAYKASAQTYQALADAYAAAPGAIHSRSLTRLYEAQRYYAAGDNIRAKAACTLLLDSCKTSSSDQCSEAKKLLNKIEKAR